MDGELITKSYKFHVKSAQNGSFSGYASAHGIDGDWEQVDPGAFKRTLELSKGIFPILWGHDRMIPVGWSTSAAEDDHGLFITVDMLMDSEQGRYAFNFVQKGLSVGGRPGLSIGFQVPKGGDYYKDGVRHFREIALRETSICVFQANPNAIVTSTKGAVSYQDLPLASEDTAWDESNAREKLAQWAGGGEDESKINWNRYKRGFLFCDSSAPNEKGSYKLPIATINGGKLVAVPRAIYACAGGHGVDSADIPPADRVKIKGVLRKYYAKLKKDPPPSLKSEGAVDQTEEIQGGQEMADTNVNKSQDMSMIGEVKAADFMATMQANNDMSEHYDNKYKMDKALRDTMDNIHSDKSMDPEDKKLKMHKSLDQHCKCMKAWWSKLVDITTPAEGEDEVSDDDAGKALMTEIQTKLSKGQVLTVKEGRVISAATASHLTKAISAIKSGMSSHEDAMDSVTKGLGHLTALSHGRYWNDVNAPNPVGGTVSDPTSGDTTHPIGGGKALDELAEMLSKVKSSLTVVK